MVGPEQPSGDAGNLTLAHEVTWIRFKKNDGQGGGGGLMQCKVFHDDKASRGIIGTVCQNNGWGCEAQVGLEATVIGNQTAIAVLS